MKIGIYSTSNYNGGAAIAARRLHKAFLNTHEISSVMHTGYKSFRYKNTVRPDSDSQFFSHKIRDKLENAVWRLKTKDGKRSMGILSSISAKQINHTDYDIINLHWICDGFLSIKEIGKIKKPLVWTLHDMWPFCGTSHFPDFDSWNRWKEEYSVANQPRKLNGFDWDRWIWKRKKKHWKQPMHIVTPSHWLGTCVQESFLMEEWPVSVIPNPLDTEVFKPRKIDKEKFRKNLGRFIILSLLPYGTSDKRKGWDFLLGTIKELESKIGPDKFELVVAGESKEIWEPDIKVPIRTTGFINDEKELVELYNLADVTVLPSRMENLSQVAVEAQACGCPVVAFDVTGNRDLIEQDKTGYLAEPYSVADMAEGIHRILKKEKLRNEMSEKARKRAISNWSEEAVVQQYFNLFRKVLGN